MEREGPRRVVTPLEDAATDEIVFIAGTGTTEADMDLLAKETEIGRFGGCTGRFVGFRPEFGISSTVVEEL